MSLRDQLQRWKTRLAPVVDPDRALQATVSALIEAAGSRYALDRSPRRWEAGEPLKLLLAGYVGNRNTGADVRVAEMIRQLRHVIGDEQLELTVLTFEEELSAGYFPGVRQTLIPQLFPPFLFSECPRHDGVIACEGSMFKSRFATALSTMMSGALGMAAAEHKLSVGYGAEAGAMDDGLRAFVREHCRQSLVLCRNEASRRVLNELDVRTAPGTDTAWAFSPAPPARGRELLRRAGWDGERPLLAVCPINPFWWPVRPDVGKYVTQRLTGARRGDHYRSIYFHNHGPEVEDRFCAYLDALAEAVGTFAREQRMDVLLIGMERLDRRACEQLAQRLEQPALTFISDDHDMFDLVSVLRCASLLLSSRFHAIVCSMGAQLPSAGVTMDERIANLMAERGHEHLLLTVDDDDLAERTLATLRALHVEREKIAEDIGRTLPPQLVRLGEMGLAFADELRGVYPDLELPDRPRSWEHYLPPLPPEVERLMERFA